MGRKKKKSSISDLNKKLIKDSMHRQWENDNEYDLNRFRNKDRRPSKKYSRSKEKPKIEY